MFTKIKQWIRHCGIKDDEVILDKETYQALQEKYDKTASELTDTKTQLKLTESERDYVNKRYEQLNVEYEHDKRKIHVLESTHKYEANRYEKLQAEYDKIKNNNAQVKFELKTDKTENTKTKKPKRAKRGTCKILAGINMETGLIKQNGDAIRLYVRDPSTKRTYQRKGELNELKECLRIFNEKNNPYNQFYKICKTIMPDKRRKRKDVNIFTANGRYKITATRNGRHIHFGTCNTLEQAMEIRDYLIFKNWDESYRSKNLTTSKKKMFGQEYYTLMKVYIDMDSEYQEYLGNKETKEFYDK